MGNSPSGRSPMTSKPMNASVPSQPRSSNHRASSVTSPPDNSGNHSIAPSPQDDALVAPPPYSPMVRAQSPPVPPPVPPHDVDMRRANSTAARTAASPRPHRRTSHPHASRPQPSSHALRSERTTPPVAVDVRAPGNGVGGFVPPDNLHPGSHFTRTNSTATRPQNATATRTMSPHTGSSSPSRSRSSGRMTPASATNSEQQQTTTPAARTVTRRDSKEDPLDLLRKFDTVIIVDDSSSMEGALWHETRDALAGIAHYAARYDSNGIDLHFLNNRTVGTNLKDPDQVRRIFDSVSPSGITPTGEKLEELLLDYLLKLESTTEEKPKPVNFLILTDGAPTDDPESVIVTAARRLDAQHAPISQVGIQFVQLGSDPQATEALQEMDDELATRHNIRDMVDTTLYTGQSLTSELLGKILLGGINRRVDKKGFQSLSS